MGVFSNDFTSAPVQLNMYKIVELFWNSCTNVVLSNYWSVELSLCLEHFIWQIKKSSKINIFKKNYVIKVILQCPAINWLCIHHTYKKKVETISEKGREVCNPSKPLKSWEKITFQIFFYSNKCLAPFVINLKQHLWKGTSLTKILQS